MPISHSGSNSCYQTSSNCYSRFASDSYYSTILAEFNIKPSNLLIPLDSSAINFKQSHQFWSVCDGLLSPRKLTDLKDLFRVERSQNWHCWLLDEAVPSFMHNRDSSFAPLIFPVRPCYPISTKSYI